MLLKLSEFRLLQSRNRLLQAKSQPPIVLKERSKCPKCSENFTYPEFALYPNGTLVKKDCAEFPNVCPITGECFRFTELGDS